MNVIFVFMPAILSKQTPFSTKTDAFQNYLLSRVEKDHFF